MLERTVVNPFQARASLPQRSFQALIDEGLLVLQPYLRVSRKNKLSHEHSLTMIRLGQRHPPTQELPARYERLARMAARGHPGLASERLTVGPLPPVER